MQRYFEVPGNASSIHQDGQIAKQRLEMARQEVAALLGCQPKELVFTSGGTEADNLAILGSVLANIAPQKHVITTAIEHPAVLNPFRELEIARSSPVTYLPSSPDGIIDPGDVRRALRPETALVSVMHANNETGALQPIAEIAAIAHQAGAPGRPGRRPSGGKNPGRCGSAGRRSLLHQRPQVLCHQGYRSAVREGRHQAAPHPIRRQA